MADDALTPEMDPQELHNSLTDTLTSPDFMAQHPELPAGPMPGRLPPLSSQKGYKWSDIGLEKPARHFTGDISIRNFAGDVGNAYEQAMRKAGAPDDFIPVGRKAIESKATDAARAYALKKLTTSDPTEQWVGFMPAGGEVAQILSARRTNEALQALEKGTADLGDYRTIGQHLGALSDEEQRGFWSKLGRGGASLAQFAAETLATGGTGGAIGRTAAMELAATKLGARIGLQSGIGLGVAKTVGYGLGATAAMPQRVLAAQSKEGTWPAVAGNFLDNTILPGMAGIFERAGLGSYGSRVLKKTLMAVGGVEASEDLKRIVGASPQWGPGGEMTAALAQGDMDRLKRGMEGAALTVTQMGLLEGVVQSFRSGESPDAASKKLLQKLTTAQTEESPREPPPTPAAEAPRKIKIGDQEINMEPPPAPETAPEAPPSPEVPQQAPQPSLTTQGPSGPSGEPPVPPGHTRYYRGETHQGDKMKTTNPYPSVTPDRSEAERFLKGQGGSLWYADAPNNWAMGTPEGGTPPGPAKRGEFQKLTNVPPEPQPAQTGPPADPFAGISTEEVTGIAKALGVSAKGGRQKILQTILAIPGGQQILEAAAKPVEPPAPQKAATYEPETPPPPAPAEAPPPPQQPGQQGIPGPIGQPSGLPPNLRPQPPAPAKPQSALERMRARQQARGLVEAKGQGGKIGAKLEFPPPSDPMEAELAAQRLQAGVGDIGESGPVRDEQGPIFDAEKEEFEVAGLDDMERQVVALRRQGVTQAEIGRQLKYTKARINQIEKKAQEKLGNLQSIFAGNKLRVMQDASGRLKEVLPGDLHIDKNEEARIGEAKDAWDEAADELDKLAAKVERLEKSGQLSPEQRAAIAAEAERIHSRARGAASPELNEPGPVHQPGAGAPSVRPAGPGGLPPRAAVPAEQKIGGKQVEPPPAASSPEAAGNELDTPVPDNVKAWMKDLAKQGERTLLEDVVEKLKENYSDSAVSAARKEAGTIPKGVVGKFQPSRAMGSSRQAEGGQRKFWVHQELDRLHEQNDPTSFDPSSFGAASPATGAGPGAPGPNTPGAAVAPPQVPGAPPTPPTRTFLQKAMDFVGSLAQKTFPALTRQSKDSGEALAAASNAPGIAEHTWNYMQSILRVDDKGTLLKDLKKYSPEDILAGTTWMEMRARYFRNELKQAGKDSSGVVTFIGQPNSPLKTEADFSNSIAKHWDLFQSVPQEWTPVVERYYRQLFGMDPMDAIDNQSQIPALPLNAIAVREGQQPTPGMVPVGQRLANLRVRKGGYTQAAGLNAPAYDCSLKAMMEKTLTDRVPDALRADAVRQLIKDDLIKVVPSGERGPAGYEELMLRPNRGIPDLPHDGRYFAPPDLANEIEAGLKIGKSAAQQLGASETKGVTGRVAQVSILSPAELMTHLGSNLPTALFEEGMGIPGVNGATWLKNAYDLYSKEPVVLEKLMKLAQISAAFRGREPTGLLGERAQAWDPTYHINRFTTGMIDLMQNALRVQLGDAYDRMVRAGTKPDSATAKRDFINGAAGNYNNYATNALTRLVKQTGLQPFATAATTYTAHGIRAGTGWARLSAPATSGQAALVSHALQLAKILPLLSIGPIANYLMWGETFPHDVPPFAVKTDEDKKGGKVSIRDPLAAAGIRRGWRALGANAAVQGLNEGKTGGQIFDKATTDLLHTGEHMVAGPPAEMAHIAATGENLYGYRVAPKVSTATTQAGKVAAEKKGLPPPGSSQTWENLKAALTHSNIFLQSAVPMTPKEQQQTFLSRLSQGLGPLAPNERSAPSLKKKIGSR